MRLKDTCTFVIETMRIKRTGSVKLGSVETPELITPLKGGIDDFRQSSMSTTQTYILIPFEINRGATKAHTEMNRREILREEDPNPSKKTVVSRNKRLFAVVSGLEARTTNGQYIDYLSAEAYNIAYLQDSVRFVTLCRLRKKNGLTTDEFHDSSHNFITHNLQF